MNGRLILPMLGFVVLAFADAHFSQLSADDRNDCAQSKNPNRMIRGCSRLLKRKGLSKKSRSRINFNLAAGYLNRGNSYLSQSQRQKAISDYSRAIKTNPNNWKTYNNRAVAILGKNKATITSEDFDRVIADLDMAIRLNPKSAQTYYYRGLAHLKNNDHSQAIVDYSQAIKLSPESAQTYRSRAIVFWLMREITKAAADCDRATKIDPKIGKDCKKTVSKELP